MGATQLRKLIGMEFKDTYMEVSVAARNKARLTVDIPEGTEIVEWDWVLAEFTINFAAFFYGVGCAEPQELQRVEQHSAEAGPYMGILDNRGAGRLEFIFDNSFSIIRGKTIQF